MPGCYAVFHKQLGDLLLLEPALSRLASHHGGPVRVLTRTGHAPLLALMDGAEFQSGAPLAWKNHLVCFDPLHKSAFRSLITPAGRKDCVLPERREMEWFHPLVFRQVIVPELGDRYVAEYFWSHTPAPPAGAFRPPRLTRPPETWRPAGTETEFILVNPTSGWRQKCWEADRWAELLTGLHARWGLPFLMTSAFTDWQVAHCAEIAAAAGPLVRSLASGTSLEQFLWLCAHARKVLTVDGAASHLAQAFGVPCLTLFGPTSLSNWHHPTPRHRAIQAAASRDGKRRLRNLAVAEVFDAASAL